MRTRLLLGVLALSVLTTCADTGTDQGALSTGTSAPTGTAVARPDGPVAAVAGPLTGGRGIALGTAGRGPDLAAAGYTEQEYAVSGRATSYRSVGELPADGRFQLEPDATADYTSRIVVRRPADPGRFNGTVAVEWLNVSGGLDAAPDYTYVADELVRSGMAWVGVSAQRIGIEGGNVAVRAPGAETGGAGQGLRALDPERYGQLRHPGDAFAYDLYTQVARALRPSESGGPLGGLRVERLLAVGESQSAMTLTTYRNGVQPLTKAFDGFLIHSRFAAGAPLGQAGGAIDIAGSLGGKPTAIRTDDPVPTLVVQTETDVLGALGYLAARQPDNEHLRVWEIAGTAHADRYQLAGRADALGCGPINNGQQHLVLKAALRHLDTWARGRGAPPSAPLLDVDSTTTPPRFVVDEDGNVRGGVRTPAVEAPVDVLSGMPGGNPSVICLLMGTTTPLPPERLAARYPSRDAYVAEYTRATDRAVAAGFVLVDDRAAALAEAQPSRLPG